MNRALLCLLMLLSGLGQALAVSKPSPPQLQYADVRNPSVVPTYLVICPEQAVAEVEPLARYHAAHGQTVRLATCQQIYQAYSAGKIRPEAIRDFLDALRQTSPGKLKFVLLVGTADLTTKSDYFLPAWSLNAEFTSTAVPCDEFIVSDAPYAMAAGAAAPDLAVGRLPARSTDSLRVMVRKAIDAQQAPPGPGRRSVGVLAGEAGFGPIADSVIERIFRQTVSRQVPDYLDLRLTYASAASPYCYAPSQMSHRIIDELNRGPGMMLYVGHGQENCLSPMSWQGRSVELLDESMLTSLHIPRGRTLFFSLTCLTGRFDAASPSLGEALLGSPGGPAAFIGASGISQPYGNAILGGVLAGEIADPPATTGELLLAIRTRLMDAEPTAISSAGDVLMSAAFGSGSSAQQRQDTQAVYNLLGDPATPLGIVRSGVKVQAPSTVQAGQSLSIDLVSPIAHGQATISLTIQRDVMLKPLTDPASAEADTAGAMANRHAAANDKVAASIQVEVVAGKAHADLSVPADCPEGLCHVNAYVQGPNADLAGTAAVEVGPATSITQPSAGTSPAAVPTAAPAAAPAKPSRRYD